MGDSSDEELVVKKFKAETSDGEVASIASRTVKVESHQHAKSSNVGMRLMAKMGFKAGQGLGREGQGIAEPISVDASNTRMGFGHTDRKHTIIDPNATWDDSKEQKYVTEEVHFIECSEDVRETIRDDLGVHWIRVDKPINTLRDADDFCSTEVVNGVIEAKATANVDRVFDWRLSREFDAEKRRPEEPANAGRPRENTTRDEEMFYFADVCAGPGGFSEYMIWRKGFYNVKGFGFTLRGNDDFKLRQFRAGSSAFFETYYGVQNDGDVTVPKNLDSLAEFVKKRTNGQGCHLVMCDGGFSVQGKEEIQEILSKRLYLCQFIVGLSLCRVGDGTPGSGGNFFCKLFDVFTPFSAGLIYLMYAAFEKITLHKPHTSRPANSERYIFCEGLTEFGAQTIKGFFTHINNTLDTLAAGKDVIEIFPVERIKADAHFFEYFREHIETFAERQILYLNKYREFAKNKGVFDSDQVDLREQCLEYWEVPDGQRSKNNDEWGKPGIMMMRSLLRNQQFEIERVCRFTLTGDSWKQDEKQVRLLEQVAVLMPEHTPPMLLFSNNQVFGRDLAPDSTYTNVLFVVDAAQLNGDNVGDFDYFARIKAIRKFCQASPFHLHAAEPLDLRQLKERFADYHVGFIKEKAKHVAVKEFKYPRELGTPDETLFWPCQSVRFVQRLKPKVMACWSNSNAKVFLFDGNKGTHVLERAPELTAGFFDLVPLSGNSKLKPIVWTWSWQADSYRDFGPKEILEKPTHPHGLDRPQRLRRDRRAGEHVRPASVRRSFLLS
ncbi:Cap-specific mRNA (nucleoside-2'-O-)-methyltransferase 1 [Aphelenchoides fujianensis]|nr:Cap-specific mRNA (nucleoside-2'-O-)-methyltransferase 1 [Aphelenchoides fujianensis]